MISVVKNFFAMYSARIFALLFVVAVSYLGYVHVNLALTKAALKSARSEVETLGQTVRAQERAIEAINDIENFTREVRAEVRAATQRIEEAEGTNDEVPPEVSAAWAAGIDSVRAPNDSNSGLAADVRGPTKAKRNYTDGGPIGYLLRGTGGGSCGVSPETCPCSGAY